MEDLPSLLALVTRLRVALYFKIFSVQPIRLNGKNLNKSYCILARTALQLQPYQNIPNHECSSWVLQTCSQGFLPMPTYTGQFKGGISLKLPLHYIYTGW